MEVTIEGQALNYTSDFDPIDIQSNVSRNWRVSAGDYFKFPITIGNHQCFVKRFDRIYTEISGYNFLMRIKGKQLRGLPRIFDLVRVKEGNKEVLYLFMEFLHGDTLDALQRRGFNFVPAELAEDLFHAFASIHANGFWFPDFDPKNLFRSDAGRYYLIDLDSTYAIDLLPQAKMYGSKDYWSPVYDFFREKENLSSSEIKKLRGDIFNGLHLLYFLSLYAYYLFEDGTDLTAHSLQKLNDFLTVRYKLFTTTMRYCFLKNPDTGEIRQRVMSFEVLYSFLTNCLFKDSHRTSIYLSAQTKRLKPQMTFSVKGGKQTYVIGETYTLLWNTSNVSEVLLDDVALPAVGKKDFQSGTDARHVFKTVYVENGVTKRDERVIAIKVVAKPVLSVAVTPLRAKPGGSVKVIWTITNAREVNMLINGALLIANCTDSGSKDVVMPDEKGDYVIEMNAKALAGDGVFGSNKFVVKVAKQTYAGVYFFLAFVVLAVFLASVKSCSSDAQRYSDASYAGADSTAVTADSAVAMIDTVAVAPAPAVDTAAAAVDTTASFFDRLYSFDEEFIDGNVNAWLLPDGDNAKGMIINQHLDLQVFADFSFHCDRYFPIDLSADFHVSSRMGPYKGDSTDYILGVDFCADYSADKFNCFYITSSGEYFVKTYQNGVWETLRKGHSYAIYQGLKYNTLSIDKESGMFTFYINDIKVESLYSLTMYGHRFGVRTQGIGTEIFVDNFKLNGVKQN
jgi:hypothetical protein